MAYDGKDTWPLKHMGVSAWNSWRASNPGTWPDLVGADLRGLDLRGVDFFTADLRSADLSGANLEGADLGGSILIWTNFTKANLKKASFYMANFNGAILSGADLDEATMAVTILVDLDLRGVAGLNSIRHLAPSHVGIDTLYRSRGSIPEAFLTAAGVPKGVIESLGNLPNLSRSFHSCFISYSTEDAEFADRLHGDLRSAGVRCWYAPKDLRIGARIRSSLDEAIGQHDRVLLVLSKASLESQWVEQEVERALEIERRNERLVLFPVRIDDTVFETTGWATLIRNSRHIGDFKNWRREETYQGSLSRLLGDLKRQAEQEQENLGSSNLG